MGTQHYDPPAFLPLKTDPAHLRFALRTARSCVVDAVCRRDAGGVRGGRYDTGICRLRRHRSQQLAAFGEVALTMTVPIEKANGTQLISESMSDGANVGAMHL